MKFWPSFVQACTTRRYDVKTMENDSDVNEKYGHSSSFLCWFSHLVDTQLSFSHFRHFVEQTWSIVDAVNDTSARHICRL